MSFFDRLSKGPGWQSGQMQQQDYNDWNQMVGAAPPDQFNSHATNAVRQLDPQEYYQHSQPGVGGTDPFGQIAGGERTGLAQSILGALLGRGVNQSEISRGTGINQLDPNRLSPDQLAQLAQWTQRNHPEAMGQVASQYQDKPDLLSSLLGNKALMMILAGLGAKFLSDRARQR